MPLPTVLTRVATCKTKAQIKKLWALLQPAP